MIRKHVVSAVMRRNFGAYFRSLTGYVFLAVFILAAAVLAFWPDLFWVNNLDNLDVLNRFFPYLLLFFVPAVAMSTWAEERKQGTDELLLTLPATDLELVLGKYLATVGIYAASLLFSLTYIFVLIYLGSPDYGVVFGTYLGYLFLGATLLSVAMIASLLTSSLPVAFVLGALFCVVTIFLGSAASIVPWKLPGGWIEGLSVDDAFAEFTSGVLSLRSVVYFVSVTVLMLYLNLMLLARRHTQHPDLWLHRAARAASIFVIAVSLGVLCGRAGARADVTQERLHSLSPATREVLNRLDSSRPVVVQAYISPEVPTEYVETRATLLGLLRDMARMSGGTLQVQVIDTEPASLQAREADERFGIKENPVRRIDEGEATGDEIFMGVAFTCAGEEVVLPFITAGTPIEYELTRSIGTVSGLKRRKVGIASTDAKMFGGFDFQSMRSQGEWRIVSELRKQYEVVQVSLDQPVTDKYDCLIVGMPSSLNQPQMDNLLAFLRQGNAGLLLDDPWPEFSGGQLSPDAPKAGPGRGMMGGQPPSEPKGDLYRFMEGIGLRWPSESMVGDHWNHHRQMQDLPKEVVFIGPGSGNPEAFNPREPISAKLQEMAFIFPGFIEARSDLSNIAFTPLLSTSRQSAWLPRSQVFQRNPFGMGASLNPRRNYFPGDKPLTLAARVEGTFPPAPHVPGTPTEKGAKIKLVFVADLDCVSDLFFRLRESRERDLTFDNITFVLNTVDALAGDESYIELRKRRPRLRTLTAVEALDKKHVEKASLDEKKAEEDAKKELEEARKRLDDAVEEIKKRTDVDLSTKQNMAAEVEEQEKRRFEMKEKEINDRKKSAVKRSETDKKEATKQIRKNIKVLAVLLPPIPAILVALIFFFQRAVQPKRSV